VRILMPYENVFPHAFGGLESRNYQLATSLCRRGHAVTLAAFYDGDGDELAGPHRPRLLRLGSRAMLYDHAGRRRARSALRLAAAMARIDLGPYDVIETPNMPYAHLWPLAARCRLARRPLIVTWYEYWGPYWRRYVGPRVAPAYAAAEWIAARLGTAVVAPSRLTADRLSSACRGRAVPVLPCGVDVAGIQNAAERGAHAGPSIVFAGRLLAHKRLDLLLRALPSLPHVGPRQPLLTIFGDGPERARLERLTAELSLADRVCFRGHVARPEAIWEAFGAARVAVQPSSREGFGLFPLEAMAAGLPVVYCDSPDSAVSELVRDGREGVCCAPEPAALARTLAAADGPRWPDMAEAARARAREYDWSVVTPRFEELCAEVIAGRTSPDRHRARPG
jgi:glycosyltransferase involved in cell wall biosynthesis